jgi:hypothetical protein
MNAKLISAAVLSCSAFLASTSFAQAGLTMDLRATRVNGSPLGAGQTPHAITNAQIGDVIAFDVFAVVTGTDQNFANDKFVSAIGSIMSVQQLPTANLNGNLAMDVVRTPVDPDTGDPIPPYGFDGNGFSIGTQQDLDADGDIDVGSNDGEHADHHWAVRYRLAPSAAPAGLPGGARIGFGTFTVTSGAPGAASLIQFIARDHWYFGFGYDADGTRYFHGGQDSLVENSVLVARAIPEPALMGAAAAAMLVPFARRRRR